MGRFLVVAPRLGVTGLAAVVLSTAVACSSSSGNDPSPTPSRSASSSPRPPLPTSAVALPQPPPANAKSLAALMRTGLALTGFAHVSVRTTVEGSVVTAVGDEVLVSGRLTGIQLDQQVPVIGSVRILVVNSIEYARLPKPTKAGTTYTVLSESSKNPDVANVARGFRTVGALAAPGAFESLVSAATTLTSRGRSTASGVDVLRYRVASDVSALPATDPFKASLASAGITHATLDLAVDGRGRPVTVTVTSAQGSASPTAVTFSAYNRKFTLNAPDARDVDPGR